MAVRRQAGFTLVELLAVVAVLAVLAALLLPAVTRATTFARTATCASNLRQMFVAYVGYAQDHDGEFFPWSERQADGTLWYWGFEPTGAGGGEGGRAIDRSRARLAPYIGADTVETCPNFPYRSTKFKRKFQTSTYGYGLNVHLIRDTPEQRASGVSRWGGIARPADTLLWADAAQVNRFQPPATPANPLLEEWYYIANRPGEWPTTHFRHGGKANTAFCDGSIRALEPASLLGVCDGLVGSLEPRGTNYYLMTYR